MSLQDWTNPDTPTRRLVQRISVPTLTYIVLAFACLGTAAFISSANMMYDNPNVDIWQHVAAIRALMDNLSNPTNPFVATSETSRHFHPLWVAAAWLGLSLELSVWQVLTLASFASMAVLATGIYAFSRVYFKSPWGASVLLLTMLFGWFLQFQYTGFHSLSSLLYTAVYPATFLIGFSFILWAVTIVSLGKSKYSLWIVPLVAFMFVTHQLGAVIGLIGAGCLVLFWPDTSHRARAICTVAILSGLAISTLWPYHNPVDLILSPGHSTFEGGREFFHPVYLGLALTPAAIGVFGLVGRRHRAMLLACGVFCMLYSIGFFGPEIVSRFLMPMILILHIGLATFILSGCGGLIREGRWRDRVVSVGFGFVIVWFIWTVWEFQARAEAIRPPGPSVYEAAGHITRDIPDTEEIAAHGISAWPVVAVGQRVHSVPWPEPGISDLGERQGVTSLLFDKTLTWRDRLATARTVGVKTLIADERLLNQAILAQLSENAYASLQHGVMWRFDLYP